MVKNVITEEHRKEAVALKAIYKAKAKLLNLTQEKLGLSLGGSGQSTASNYLNAVTALNLKSAWIFAKELDVNVSDFSPRLAQIIDIEGQDEALGQIPILDKWDRLSQKDRAKLLAMADLLLEE